MKTRDDRLWSALMKQFRSIAAELDKVAEAEATAIAAAYAAGESKGTIRGIEQDAEAKSRKFYDAWARLEREALKLDCGCGCDGCVYGRNGNKEHCASAPCKHDPELQRKL